MKAQYKGSRRTALDIAKAKGHLTIAELLEKGAPPEEPHCGDTWGHYGWEDRDTSETWPARAHGSWWRESTEPEIIETVPIHKIANLQKSCSSRFPDGRSLDETTDDLRYGRVDPMNLGTLQRSSFVNALSFDLCRRADPAGNISVATRAMVAWACYESLCL